MRNEIEINGVKLTREQLEDAVKRLNEPEEVIRPGDMFHGGTGTRFMMINKNFVDGLLKLCEKSSHLSLCVDAGGTVHTFDPKLHKLAIKRGDHQW